MVLVSRAVSAAVAWCFLAGAAHAESLTLAVEDLLGSVTVYMGEEPRKGRAVLSANKDGGYADLRIYLEVNKDSQKRDMKLAVTKTEVVFSGSVGQEASLAVSDRGSLLVKSQNYGIGRTKWEQALTIVYWKGEFVVAGFTYKAMDVDSRFAGTCDINLLTGQGVRNGRPVSLKAGGIRLVEWSDEKMPKECKFG